MEIQKPYLLFLADAHDRLAAKVALGIRHWHPEYCVGQLRMAGCQVDCGLPDLDIAAARAHGAKTLVVGVANRGGVIADNWVALLCQALESGMDLAAGLHNRLADVPELKQTADRLGRSLFDVRHTRVALPVANGRKRAGKRLLPVGTDCSCGKMYTALAIEKAMLARGLPATFRATGQTGILVSGAGISIDAVVADFIAGAVELLAPENAPDHWDVIEGQGSLFHPSFSGVTTGLIHGAQPDALVLCHEPTRTAMRGVDYPLPDLDACMALNLQMARLTNPLARFVGISINSAQLADAAALDYMAELEHRFGLPVVDPFRQGVDRIIDGL
ncbi:N-acetyltransferase DgcN [Acerihabitans sp. TG2]|uniref:N-acetyltransferase DgcN n=1 Tax=Acerihabitans sp. TG2 TaxID=3096008 RepID=UPI002B22B20D|nr:N-acetyltransferase DgcN [Acerihabitans sp. TG2]MEA9390499.1 N-acetyltransferase DgcN [Acerihabitans sp. TG2]